ncbi:MAG: hypothetical protein K0S28_2211 [Paucimonas sp.]|nr:hypothetical protein [Paucimonas sp.]
MLKLPVKRLCAAFSLAAASFAAHATPITVYGAWLCSNDACGWSAVRDMTDFDAKNRWLVDRGDGRPSVNVVVLSFVNPLKLLNKTNDAGTVNGVPKGMTQAVVNYFKSKNVRVQLSMGGITYTDAWNTALATNPTQLGLNAVEVAQALGVGFEIDYEENTNPNLTGLQAFVDAYRSRLPYDPTGNNHAARLTIDLAPGDRWLTAITRKATIDWLGPNPVLDYANAMVPDSGAERRRQYARHAGLYVLGSRMPLHAQHLHHAAQQLRERRGRRRDNLQHSYPNAAGDTLLN